MKRILLFFITIFSASLFAQLSFDYESSGQILPNSEGVSQIDLPVTFDASGIDYTMGDFGGNVSTLAADPSDASNTVIEVVKTQGAEEWAGTTIGTATGFATAIPFTASNSKMSVRVWSPSSGLPIRLKVEEPTTLPIPARQKPTRLLPMLGTRSLLILINKLRERSL